MTAEPILILQMQRMGDLILSFPLMLWLQRHYPGRALFVAAEKLFFTPLLPFSPQATYIPWEAAGELKKRRYRLVINLSIREEAARLAGELDTEEILGPVLRRQAHRVHGPWQIYRAALVRNNRGNRFHWADLNALDCIPMQRMAATRFDPPRPPRTDKLQVGLFLGASDAAKRPSPAFWAGLLKELVRRDIRPVLFGGPGETELGRETRALFGRPVPDFCGKLKLDELGRALNACSLLITPDTGPMHLAAWTGCRTLNLSMGNVSPFETGPYQPGHLVLRADLPCSEGCWECTRPALECHAAFTPETVAYVAGKACAGRPLFRAPQGLRLWETGRDSRGLHTLVPLDGSEPDIDERLGRFWKAFFCWRLGLGTEQDAREALSALSSGQRSELAATLPGAVSRLRNTLAQGPHAPIWNAGPDPLSLLTGYADMTLRNADFAPTEHAAQLAHLEALGILLSG
ncbi:MAG: glycosyltransferase family 9 protein [Desulfovibrionaceae bacterium]